MSYTQIASDYLELARVVTRVAAATTWPEGSPLLPVSESLDDSVQRTQWSTDRLTQEES
jgi:hypothetical protein